MRENCHALKRIAATLTLQRWHLDSAESCALCPCLKCRWIDGPCWPGEAADCASGSPPPVHPVRFPHPFYCKLASNLKSFRQWAGLVVSCLPRSQSFQSPPSLGSVPRSQTLWTASSPSSRTFGSRFGTASHLCCLDFKLDQVQPRNLQHLDGQQDLKLCRS